MKKIAFLIAAVFILSACNNQAQDTPEDLNPDAYSENVITEDANYFLLEEVAKHSTPEDCWIVLDGKVYDVSDFGGAGHGGGDAVYEGCGIDATQLYETRPMGSGTPHSEKARGFLPNFYIGDLSS